MKGLNDSWSAARLWDDYTKARDDPKAVTFATKVRQCYDFYEGRHWKEATKETRNFPRVKTNFTRMIVDTKLAVLFQAPFVIKYKSYGVQDIRAFNDFASFQMRVMQQSRLDRRAGKSAAITGQACFHYYWDKEAKGRRGSVTGAMACEVIDPTDVFVSNRDERDIQSQEWIIMRKHVSVESVRAKCDRETAKLIVPDEWDKPSYDYDDSNARKDKVTVLIRYFRVDGEVYCEEGTKTTLIREPFWIAPDVETALGEINASENMDAPNNDVTDAADSEKLSSDAVKAGLYPVVWWSWIEKINDAYGIGEAEGVIPNNMVYNFTQSMIAMNVRLNAWTKWSVMPGALKNGQRINDNPGQVLVDNTGTGNGIKPITPPMLNTYPTAFCDNLMENTRATSGATQVLSGEVISAGMSGAAIAELQSQANLPIEQIREDFRLTKEEQGKVYAQFFKLYYTDESYIYQDEDGEDMEGTFSSGEFQDVDFEIVVEAEKGAYSSTAGNIALLETLFNAGAIDRKTFIELYPEDAISNRAEIMEAIERQEQDASQQLQVALQQLEELKKEHDMIQSIVRENDSLKTQLVAVTSQAIQTINRANEQTAIANDTATRTMDDARKLAEIASRKYAGKAQKSE